MSDIFKPHRAAQRLSFPEKVALIFLSGFLLMAVLGPVSGWLMDPNEIDETFQPPFSGNGVNGTTRHWLGTDSLGRDVLANLVYGSQTALWVSLPAMLLATIIGLLLGCAAGFWGNTSLTISLAGGILSIGGTVLSFYYGIYLRQFAWLQAFQEGSFSVLREAATSAVFFIIMAIFCWLMVKAWHRIAPSRSLNLPADKYRNKSSVQFPLYSIYPRPAK